MIPQDRASWTRRCLAMSWKWRWEVATIAAVVTTAGLPLVVPHSRRQVRQWLRHARTRRLIRAALTELRMVNTDGRLPRIKGVEEKPFGERVHLRIRPGLWSDVLLVRAAALATAARAASVRVDKDPQDASRVTLDVVRRDPFARVGLVPWQDRDVEQMSMFDPVHLGIGEDGKPIRLTLVERSLLLAGLPGVGKSSAVQVIVSHAAKSPDAVLVLVDPKRVELSHWQDRAWLYAGPDMAEALDVVQQVHAEMERRLSWLETAPGVQRKITRETGIPLLLFVVDELAYHLSVVGSGEQRALFSRLVRDILARGRAAGLIVIAATQRPTNEVVPTSLSGLFAMRAAGRVQSPEDSDRVLGANSAKGGWDASEIGINDRGVLIMTSEDRTPMRLKAAYIDDTTIADLSVTTIPLKPRRPSVAPVGAADRAA